MTLQTLTDWAAKTAKPKAKRQFKSNGQKANELNGNTWLQYSISVWNDIKKSPEEIKLGHPAMFPGQLAKRIIQIFANKDQKVVLDPFCGSGSTILAAMELGKQGVGFDISKEYVELTKSRLNNLELFEKNAPAPTVIHDDANNLLKYVKKESVDLCFTSPPYWDILSQERTADYKKIRDYSEAENNLGSITNYVKFIRALGTIFQSVYTVLRPKSYCVVNVMDLRKKAKFYPLHMDLSNELTNIGFILDDIIIWDRQKEYNNLRPLGYPNVFRINKVHEFLLIFQKPHKK